MTTEKNMEDVAQQKLERLGLSPQMASLAVTGIAAYFVSDKAKDADVTDFSKGEVSQEDRGHITNAADGINEVVKSGDNQKAEDYIVAQAVKSEENGSLKWLTNIMKKAATVVDVLPLFGLDDVAAAAIKAAAGVIDTTAAAAKGNSHEAKQEFVAGAAETALALVPFLEYANFVPGVDLPEAARDLGKKLVGEPEKTPIQVAAVNVATALRNNEVVEGADVGSVGVPTSVVGAQQKKPEVSIG